MNSEIKKFILQSQTSELKTSTYPRDFLDFEVKVSFGMGTPAKISGLVFTIKILGQQRGSIVSIYIIKERIF